MIIVGINDDHGASCAIMKDGVIIYAANEERFSLIKNDAGFPFNSL